MPYVESEPHWGDADFDPMTPSLWQYVMDIYAWKLAHNLWRWDAGARLLFRRAYGTVG